MIGNGQTRPGDPLVAFVGGLLRQAAARGADAHMQMRRDVIAVAGEVAEAGGDPEAVAMSRRLLSTLEDHDHGKG